MYLKFIKFVVLLSLLVCCGFAGRVLYSRFFNLVVQGKDPRHSGSLADSLLQLSFVFSFFSIGFSLKRFLSFFDCFMPAALSRFS